MQLEEPQSICFRSKWKADRAAVTSLCVSPDGKLLLSAGHIIKMWDLDTKEVYRVSAVSFVCALIRREGHYSEASHKPGSLVGKSATVINQPNIECFSAELIPVLSSSPPQKFTGHSTAVTTLRFATTRPPDSNGLYFLSGAAHDRLLSVW